MKHTYSIIRSDGYGYLNLGLKLSKKEAIEKVKEFNKNTQCDAFFEVYNNTLKKRIYWY